MLRRLLVLLTSIGAALLGLFLWNKRDELRAEVERVRGERRAAAAGAAGSATARAGRGAAPSSPPGTAAAGLAAARARGSADDAAGRAPEKTRETAPPAAGAAPGAASPEAAEPDRCVARTHSGTRCTRVAEPGSDTCWQHGN